MTLRVQFTPLLHIVAVLVLSTGCKDRDKASQQLPTQPTEVTVAKPLVRKISDAVEYTGHTAALESVEVRARVTGFLDKIHVKPRAVVEPGQPLFTIDPRPFQAVLDQAKAELAAGEAQLVRAKFIVEKIEGLKEQGAYSEEEYVTNVSNRDAILAAMAEAQAHIVKAELDLSFCNVTAPIHGRIGRNLVDAGNIVMADTTILAHIVNDDDLYAYVNASERDVLTIRERKRQSGEPNVDQAQARGAQIPAHLGLMTEEGFPHDGTIDYIAPQLDTATGTVQLRGRFRNPEGTLIAGLFVRVRIPLGEPYDALVVTERAMGSDQGQRYVLVVTEDNIVESRIVSVGTVQDGMRVITKGVIEGDRVIVNGMQRVRPGVAVKPHEVEMPTGAASRSTKANEAAKPPAATAAAAETP